MLAFAINYLQFKRVDLFENIFLVFQNPSFSPHAYCESNGVHR